MNVHRQVSNVDDGEQLCDSRRKRVGIVKAAIDMYAGKVFVESPSPKKPLLDFKEAEEKLSTAKKTVKTLSSLIEEAKISRKEQKKDVELSKYAEVTRELEFVRQELCKIKLDMGLVLKEKYRANKETEESRLKISSNLSYAEELKKEIDEVNDEQMIVELAMIEATKEFTQVQTQQEVEAGEFSSAIKIMRKKINNVVEEIEASKELENKLAVKMNDIDLVRNQLIQFKQQSSRESEVLPLLASIMEEVEAGNREFDSIREEGFQFMESMDIIRSELKRIGEKVSRAKKNEEKRELITQKLNSKLLRMKSKLECISAAEERTKSVASDLLNRLAQLKAETVEATKEKEAISEEISTINVELPISKSRKELAETMLENAMQELEEAKESETSVLENLKNVNENARTTRASTFQQRSSISISKFEYDYLMGRAIEAKEVADKKVIAAEAWIEALKASEKQMAMMIEKIQREMRVEEMQAAISAKRKVENVEDECTETPLVGRTSRKGTPLRRAKFIKSGSPRFHRSTSFTIRKRKKVMPNFAKFFSGKKVDEKYQR